MSQPAEVFSFNADISVRDIVLILEACHPFAARGHVFVPRVAGGALEELLAFFSARARCSFVFRGRVFTGTGVVCVVHSN